MCHPYYLLYSRKPHLWTQFEHITITMSRRFLSIIKIFYLHNCANVKVFYSNKKRLGITKPCGVLNIWQLPEHLKYFFLLTLLSLRLSGLILQRRCIALGKTQFPRLQKPSHNFAASCFGQRRKKFYLLWTGKCSKFFSGKIFYLYP